MRKLIAELFDPRTRYEYELPLPSDIMRARNRCEVQGDELGLLDGIVAAVAERRKIYRVLTTDRREFSA